MTFKTATAVDRLEHGMFKFITCNWTIIQLRNISCPCLHFWIFQSALCQTVESLHCGLPWDWQITPIKDMFPFLGNSSCYTWLGHLQLHTWRYFVEFPQVTTTTTNLRNLVSRLINETSPLLGKLHYLHVARSTDKVACLLQEIHSSRTSVPCSAHTHTKK